MAEYFIRKPPANAAPVQFDHGSITTPNGLPSAAPHETDADHSTLENCLERSRNQGRPLPSAIRTRMENGFGADFGRVRIHAGPEAVSMSRYLQAQAFTHENHIFFNTGRFKPNTVAGQKLLAHELTHVVQQTGSQSARIEGGPTSRAPGPLPQPLRSPRRRPEIGPAVIQRQPELSLIDVPKMGPLGPLPTYIIDDPNQLEFLADQELFEMYLTEEDDFTSTPNLFNKTPLFQKKWIRGAGAKVISKEITQRLKGLQKSNSLKSLQNLLLLIKNADADLDRKDTLSRMVIARIQDIDMSKSSLSVKDVERYLTLKPGTKGKVPESVREEAEANLRTLRQVIGDLHSDMNSIFLIIQNLKALEDEDLLTADFGLLLLYEVTEGIAVALPDELEAIGIIVAKLVKVSVQTGVRMYRASRKNEATMEDVNDIAGMLTMLQFSRDEIDQLLIEAADHPQLAYDMAAMSLPKTPGKFAGAIAGDWEFRLYRKLLKRKGAELALRRTDQLNLDTKVIDYESTEHYKTARKRHQDAADNWFLSPDHPRFGSLPFHPTADRAYYWSVLIIEGVPDKLIQHIMKRMRLQRIAKNRLYDRHGADALTVDEKSTGSLFEVDVIK